ncbi:hypothetical protein GCM10011428_84140 [Streptomyces violaceus]
MTAPPLMAREHSRPRGSTGERASRSRSAKAAAASTARPTPASTAGSDQPRRPASLSAPVSRATDATTAHCAGQSRGRSARRGERPTCRRVSARQAAPTGRLMRNTQRQPTVETSSPPSSGPAEAAMPAIEPHSPKARERTACSG